MVNLYEEYLLRNSLDANPSDQNVTTRGPPAARIRTYFVKLFGALPWELAPDVLLYLETLDAMRLVNSHYRALIDEFPPLKLLQKHARHTLDVLKHRTSSQIRFQWVVVKFKQPSCRKCGKFGPYVYLPTFQRCCEPCLLVDVEATRPYPNTAARAMSCIDITSPAQLGDDAQGLPLLLEGMQN